MGPFRSIKAGLPILSLCISLIPIAVITSAYYLNIRKIPEKQMQEWLTAVEESGRVHASVLPAFVLADWNSLMPNRLEAQTWQGIRGGVR